MSKKQPVKTFAVIYGSQRRDMKNLLLALPLLACSVYAQEQPVRTLTAQPATKQAATSQPVRLQKIQQAPGTIITQETDSLAGETIAHCDAVIAAIDHKVAYIRSDQSKAESAEANGWFDQMARNRAAYVARREALLQREQNH